MLAFDPQATFQIVQTQAGNNLYIGPIELSHDDPDQGFAQRTARGQYALHTFPTPKHQGQMDVEIKYRNTQPEVYIKSDKGVQR